MAQQAGARAPRSDAKRNRDTILNVADDYFTANGISGSLEAIAKRAGIGAGTLYRHFPSRDALLAGLLAARDDVLMARRAQIDSTATGAADALSEWIEALVEWAGAFDGLPEPLRRATVGDSSPLASTCEGYITVTGTYLQAAQAEGSAREDVRARDLFLSALAISWVRGAAMADVDTASTLTALHRTGWLQNQ